MNNLLQYYFLNLKYLNLVSFSVKKVIHFYSLKHDLTKFFYHNFQFILLFTYNIRYTKC